MRVRSNAFGPQFLEFNSLCDGEQRQFGNGTGDRCQGYSSNVVPNVVLLIYIAFRDYSNMPGFPRSGHILCMDHVYTYCAWTMYYMYYA